MFSLFRLHPPFIRNTCVYGNTLVSNYSKKLSSREKDTLYKTVCLIEKNPECYGLAFFKDLFKKYPDYAKFFSKYGNSAEEVLKNKKFASEHASGKLIKTIASFVRKIDDPCEAENMMKKLGKKHVKYCLKKEHFKNSKKVLLKSLEYNLGDKWCPVAAQGWKKAFKIMFRGLQNGLKTK